MDGMLFRMVPCDSGEWQGKVVAEFVDILDRHSVLAAAEGSQALVNMVCWHAFSAWKCWPSGTCAGHGRVYPGMARLTLAVSVAGYGRVCSD